MSYDGGWITGECNLPEGCTVWVWYAESGRSLRVLSDCVNGRPWQPIPEPIEPPPYVEPKPERLDHWLVVKNDVAIFAKVDEETAKRHAKSIGGTAHHVREVLPTDIDQDVVAKVREHMSNYVEKDCRVGPLTLEDWMKKLT